MDAPARAYAHASAAAPRRPLVLLALGTALCFVVFFSTSASVAGVRERVAHGAASVSAFSPIHIPPGRFALGGGGGGGPAGCMCGSVAVGGDVWWGGLLGAAGCACCMAARSARVSMPEVEAWRPSGEWAVPPAAGFEVRELRRCAGSAGRRNVGCASGVAAIGEGVWDCERGDLVLGGIVCESGSLRGAGEDESGGEGVTAGESCGERRELMSMVSAGHACDGALVEEDASWVRGFLPGLPDGSLDSTDPASLESIWVDCGACLDIWYLIYRLVTMNLGRI